MMKLTSSHALHVTPMLKVGDHYYYCIHTVIAIICMDINSRLLHDYEIKGWDLELHDQGHHILEADCCQTNLFTVLVVSDNLWGDWPYQNLLNHRRKEQKQDCVWERFVCKPSLADSAKRGIQSKNSSLQKKKKSIFCLMMPRRVHSVDTDLSETAWKGSKSIPRSADNYWGPSIGG